MWSYAVRHRRNIPLGMPGRTFRHVGMLKLVESHVGGRPNYSTIAPTAHHAWDLFIVGYGKGVVPGIKLLVDVRRDIHTPDLEGRRHIALGDIWCHCSRMNEGIDVTDKGCAKHVERAALGPLGGMGLHILVGIALQDLNALQLIIREVLWSPFDGFVPGSTQEAGDGKTLRYMFLIVPAMKLRFFVCRDIRPDHQ